MAFDDDFNIFYKNAVNSIESAKKDASFRSVDRPDVIYHSIIPWVSFTSFSNARKKGQGDDIPRIVFGKYFNSEQKLMLPVSVEVHHALMDGFHVGQYFNSLQNAMNNMANEKV
jgi:chloramphenicol O-acetyltransferase type A